MKIRSRKMKSISANNEEGLKNNEPYKILQI